MSRQHNEEISLDDSPPTSPSKKNTTNSSSTNETTPSAKTLAQSSGGNIDAETSRSATVNAVQRERSPSPPPRQLDVQSTAPVPPKPLPPLPSEDEQQEHEQLLHDASLHKFSSSEHQFGKTLSQEPLSSRSTQFLKSLRIKFRNYKPETEGLREFYSAARPSTQLLSDIANNLIKQEYDHLNVNILPVKMDWDLKRDIEKDLDELDRETMRVMKQMVEERMT